LEGAFRPPEQICALRAYLRQRANLVRYAASHIQHMQKALNQMNIMLHTVVSDITGVTGMKIIRAILQGERDPHILATFRDRRCKENENTIAKALEGNYQEEHLFSLKQAVELFDIYQEKIAQCDREIEKILNQFWDKIDIEEQPLPTQPKKRKPSRNEPKFDLRSHLYRVSGVDLTRIDGITAYTALTIISAIGVDMSPWKTEKHFASWLGLCPGNKISGGKRISGKSKPTANRAAGALRLAAQSLYNSHSALGAFLRRQKARLGAPKAITATAHKLARLVYTLLKYGTEYVDAGQDYYEEQYRQRVIYNLKRRAKQMGFCLVEKETGAIA
jgi:transposase